MTMTGSSFEWDDSTTYTSAFPTGTRLIPK